MVESSLIASNLIPGKNMDYLNEEDSSSENQDDDEIDPIRNASWNRCLIWRNVSENLEELEEEEEMSEVSDPEDPVPTPLSTWNFGRRSFVISLYNRIRFRPEGNTLIIQRLTNMTEQVDNVELALESIQLSATIITVIELQNCVLSAENFVKLFSPMQNLKCITLNECKIDLQSSHQVQLELRNVKHLKSLSSDTMLICQMFRGFNNLLTLKVEVDKDWNNDQCEALERFIQQQQSLETLSVENTWKHEHLFEFKSIPYQLKSLTLNFISLSSTSIDFFEKQNELKEVEIGFKKLSGVGSIILKEILAKLKIRTIKIKTDTEEPIDETFFADVKPNIFIHTLEFEEKIESKEAAGSLLKVLVSCLPNLSTVKVKCTTKKEIDEVYCSEIARAKHLQWLQLLDVYSNALMAFDYNVSSLTDLNLQITDDTANAQPLMDLLEANPKIAILEVSFSTFKLDCIDCTFILDTLPALKCLAVANFDNVESVMQTILSKETRLENIFITAHEKLKISEETLAALENAGINLGVFGYKMW